MDSSSSSSERLVDAEPAAKRPKTEESLQENKEQRGRDDLDQDHKVSDGAMATKDENPKGMPEKEIERLRKLLAKKDEEHEKELAKKDEEHEKELAKKDKLIAQKDQEAGRSSFQRLIEIQPDMSLETDVYGESSTSTANSNHTTAEATKREVTMQTIPKQLLNTTTSSRLLLKFDVDQKDDGGSNFLVKRYSSEADVSGYVTAALEDAIFLVKSKTGRELLLRHEFSLFSNRPDHIVLVDKVTKIPVLVVEDKRPWDTNGGENINGSVLGQVYDYLLELKREGHRAPCVVLSSFNESWLFWQDSENPNESVSTQNKPGVLVDSSSGEDVSPAKRVPTTDFTQSPPELRNEEVEAKDVLDCVFEERERNRMYRSKETYPAKKLVPLLYTAILRGLSGIPSGRCKSVSKRIGGYEGLALRLDPGCYGWGRLALEEGKPITKWKGSKSRKVKVPHSINTFFVVETIARGATSKASDAYDSSGKRCVIKMYLKQEDEEGNTLPKKESYREGKKACKLEVKRLQAFYKFLEGKVHYEELCGFPCVIMPFFEPLTKEERNKLKEDTTEIRNCLESFHDGQSRHWKYRECDLRWRHVGYFRERERDERKLVMFDLAELETVKEADFEGTVSSQVDDLVKRLPPSAAEKPCATK